MASLEDHFSIVVKYKRLLDVLDAKSILGNKSDWICKTLLKEFDEEEKGSKLDEYTKKEYYKTSKLDTLPLMGEKLTREHLDILTFDDVCDLEIMHIYNHSVIKQYIHQKHIMYEKELREK